MYSSLVNAVRHELQTRWQLTTSDAARSVRSRRKTSSGKSAIDIDADPSPAFELDGSLGLGASRDIERTRGSIRCPIREGEEW